MMLAPTHEEEITTLVAETVKSYKELPIRLYQTSRFILRSWNVITDFRQLVSIGMSFALVTACSAAESLS